MHENRALGIVEAIYVTSTATSPMQSRVSAMAVAGQGLEGDRYAAGQGTFSHWPKDHELTLIEAEVLETVAETTGLSFALGEMRRNITTRCIRLNELVGHQFWIGDVLCEGTRLCEPCAHLEALLRKPGLCRLFTNRGGLRAKIVTGGMIRVSDKIWGRFSVRWFRACIETKMSGFKSAKLASLRSIEDEFWGSISPIYQ